MILWYNDTGRDIFPYMQSKFCFLQFVFFGFYLLSTLRGGWLCLAAWVSYSQQWEMSWGYSSSTSSIFSCTSCMAACQCPLRWICFSSNTQCLPWFGNNTSLDLEAQLEKDANLSLWVCFPNLQLWESTCGLWISVPVFENCCLEHLRFVQEPVFILNY